MAIPRITKDKIFREAVALFSQRGYDNVSMKHIAKAVGINVASIYNHFESKEELLKSIYDYYCSHCYDSRPTKEAYLPILKQGSGLEIIKIFYYSWAEPEDLMMGAMRIVWERKMIDPCAQRVYQQYVMENNFSYLMEVFGTGKTIGRIQNSAEELETLAMSVLATRAFAASSVSLEGNPEKWLDYDARMLEMFGKHLQLSEPIP